jgi:imidazolonepropionase-like amidohydrolase
MGADYVKLMATGGGTPGTLPGVLTFSREELQAAADEAHTLSRKATAHATAKAGIVECVEVGLDGIEHCYFMTRYQCDYDPKLVERIARENIVVCPTLSVFKESIDYLTELGRERPLTDYENERMSWFLHMQNTLTDLCSRMRRDGIQMVAGTDAGWRLNTFGNLYQELELLSAAGFGHIGALRTATSSAADNLGIADKAGRALPGRRADLLIVNGDPGESVSNLRNVVQVFKDGIPV